MANGYATVEQLKASDEYLALGIIGRERLLALHFPEEFDQYEANSSNFLLDNVYDAEDVEIFEA